LCGLFSEEQTVLAGHAMPIERRYIYIDSHW